MPVIPQSSNTENNCPTNADFESSVPLLVNPWEGEENNAFTNRPSSGNKVMPDCITN